MLHRENGRHVAIVKTLAEARARSLAVGRAVATEGVGAVRATEAASVRRNVKNRASNGQSLPRRSATVSILKTIWKSFLTPAM